MKIILLFLSAILICLLIIYIIFQKKLINILKTEIDLQKAKELVNNGNNLSSRQ